MVFAPLRSLDSTARLLDDIITSHIKEGKDAKPMSVEETEDLTSRVLPPRLVMVHDAIGCGQDDVAELARGQQVDHPLLDGVRRHVEAGRDDAALIDAADQVDDDLAGPVVINDLELANVACA